MKVDLDYPAAVHLEIWAQCNASCNFCPYPTLDRQGVKMSDELLEKILKDLEDIPTPFYFSPFKVNEPFLDKRLPDLLDDINKRLPNAILRLFSNGTTFTDRIINRISTLQNVELVCISLNDYRRKAYYDVMRLPMDNVINKLDKLHKHKAKGKIQHRIAVSRVCDSTYHDLYFKEWVKDRYPLFEVLLIKREAWIDYHDHESIIKEIPRTKCRRWYEIDITSTGIVSLCCMDGQAKYPIGDVSKQHVLEVFNAPHYRQLREGTRNRIYYEPCNRCTYG